MSLSEVLRGHLEQNLPPVTLLLGPEHSGKKTLADKLLNKHAGAQDRMWVPWLSMEAGDRVQHFALVSPCGKLRVIVINLKGASSPALNRLLKLLEEPPPTVRFILVSRTEPLPTIRSRSQVVACVPEPEDPEAAAKAKATVLSALKAALAGDRALLSAALRNWTPEDSVMLFRWCEEKYSGRWRIFQSGDSQASQQFARRLLTALDANRGARPRLAARTALEAASRMEKLHACTTAWPEGS
jgi:hypothetical protein